MANVLEVFGTNNQVITCTLASLASAGAREGVVVDNTTNLFLDALVMFKFKTHASSAPTGDKAMYLYAYGTVDNGTTYPDTVTGADAGLTLNSPGNLRLLGAVYAAAAATTYKGGPFSVASVFGGVLPARWGVVVQNATGFSIDATGGSHVINWQGVYASVA